MDTVTLSEDQKDKEKNEGILGSRYTMFFPVKLLSLYSTMVEEGFREVTER